jgi:hypothetical protein
MCMWRAIYWIVCRHMKKQVVNCFAVGDFDTPCEGWDEEDNEQQSLTQNGRPYIRALNEMCPECRWEILLDELEEQGRRREERERRDKERRDSGTNGINGTNGMNGINGTNGTNGTHGH